WPCSQCPKSFTRRGDLGRHSLLHAGIRPHLCVECGKRFTQYSGLKTHLNVHTRDKPFRCGWSSCQATFGDPSSRARHRKETHERQGTYRCPDSRCTTSIKRRSAFSAHLRKHGQKYAGLDIDDFFVRGTNTSGRRETTCKLEFELPDPANNPGLTVPGLAPYYSNMNTLSFSDANFFDMQTLLSFDSPYPSASSSPSPPSHFSLPLSAAPSISPSPGPHESSNENCKSASLCVNDVETSASYDGTSGSFPAVPPITQFMHAFGLDMSGYNQCAKPPVFG
ncbi:hypothetical protein GGX14DRAFT_413084, partial [Mycena pura]